MAQVDYFLKLDGIPGESVDDKHRGEIDIMSFSFGVSTVVAGGGAGRGSGKSSFQDIHLSAPFNLSSPKLLLACSNGQHIKTGILTCRKANTDNPVEFLTIKLTDILVSGYSTGSNPLDSGFSSLQTDNDYPTDQFTLNFARIAVTYTPQSPTNPGLTSGGDDIVANG
jgi:type VI secretion system secreted protein Hcp